MPLTKNSDLFFSVHENGFNQIAKHFMEQRPSLFNYGTEYFTTPRGLEKLCHKIVANPVVLLRGNPLITVESPLPIFNTDPPVGLNFMFQFSEFQIDFHPGNLFGLPPELNPLEKQKIALRLKVCGGIGCPDKQFIADYGDKQDHYDVKNNRKENQPKPPIVALPTDKLNCFCLELFAVGSIDRKIISGKEYLKINLSGLEIVDIKPDGLENSLECYLKTLLTLGILPKAKIAMEVLAFNIANIISIAPTPISAAVPFNPTIENDEIALFFNLF
ncbi:hypothetical protein [Flavobacterium sp. LC2016-01]|uniref:hypothetical protein n=1 Tax=Flavobacterium sp. LC2016-01 TaxID=2675876 RepID=UPI0012BA67EB|nr:hypothetical protein [Flavobacterium sp. LC2016-01]MTH15796.1 hypothetical protein [Flavobacterium sp. LC2016-01]